MLHTIPAEKLDKLIETGDYSSYSWFQLQNEKKSRVKLGGEFSVTYRENLIRDTIKKYKDFVKWMRKELNKTRYPHEISTSEADVYLFELYNAIGDCIELVPNVHELWGSMQHTNNLINKMFSKSAWKTTTYGLEEYESLSFDSRSWPYWTFLKECCNE